MMIDTQHPEKYTTRKGLKIISMEKILSNIYISVGGLLLTAVADLDGKITRMEGRPYEDEIILAPPELEKEKGSVAANAIVFLLFVGLPTLGTYGIGILIGDMVYDNWAQAAHCALLSAGVVFIISTIFIIFGEVKRWALKQ